MRRIGLEPLAVEVKMGPDGRYRVDTLLDPTVAMEVDGYTYHAAPELKEEDERRRNRLRLGGTFVLVYDWTEVLRDTRRIAAECHEAIAKYGSAGTRSPRRVS
jgi:very-short-patch-repair endonuclease